MSEFPFYAIYEKPTSKAKLVKFYNNDPAMTTMGPLDVGAEWSGEVIEIINEFVISGNPPGKRWVARTDKGSIFQDKPIAFRRL